MQIRSLARATAVALVSTVAFAACGSDSKQAETGAATQTENQAARKTPESEAKSQSAGDAKVDVDLCGVITAADAASVFGGPAQTTDPTGPEPTVAGICIYEGLGDDATVRNLLQVRLYDGAQYYGEAVFPGAEPLEGVGDKSFIKVNEAAHLVDIQFVKAGKTGTVNYSAGAAVNVGERVDALKAVARKLAASI